MIQRGVMTGLGCCTGGSWKTSRKMLLQSIDYIMVTSVCDFGSDPRSLIHVYLTHHRGRHSPRVLDQVQKLSKLHIVVGVLHTLWTETYNRSWISEINQVVRQWGGVLQLNFLCFHLQNYTNALYHNVHTKKCPRIHAGFNMT